MTLPEGIAAMSEEKPELLQIHTWDDIGFKPLVSFGQWLVALMNWEQRFDVHNIGRVERHNITDEVFVMLEGQSVIFVVDENTLHAEEMECGFLYNVPAGTWHNVIGTLDAKWLIVENNDTSLENTEYRQLDESELEELVRQFPIWLRDLRSRRIDE
jgi:mannose-6-phosphate isomerase-like protein (cupin superfamily)